MRTGSVFAVLALLCGLGACALGSTGQGGDTGGDGSAGPYLPPNPPPPPRPPDQVDNDAGTLVGRRGSDAGETDAGPRSPGDSGGMDSGSAIDSTTGADTGSPGDSGSGGGDSSMGGSDTGTGATDSGKGGDSGPVLCANPPGAGDLAIVELMIESVNAFGDQGEWLEVQSTQASCTFNLNGLHVESPRTTSAPFTPDTLDITTDTYLPPNGIFVIADTLDPTVDNQLPTTPLLLAWAGDPSDVLQNGGDEVTLSLGGNVIQDLTYPAFQLIVGTSISFPADCSWSDLPDWSRWSYSNNFWYGTFQGTPNAANTDVTCF